MNIDDYLNRIRQTIEEIGIVASHQVLIERRSPEYGKIKIRAAFLDQSSLYFMEFVRVGRIVERYRFSYHYQNKRGEMIFRYDNSSHYPGLSSFPYHKHVGQDRVIESGCPKLSEILREISEYLQDSQR